MQITKLDHVNIRTTRLDVMTDWYTQVLGLHTGFRPEFPFPGVWLYTPDDVVVVHLVGITGDESIGSEAELKLEHFSLSAIDGEGFEDSLRVSGETYRRSELPELSLELFNLWDPDGNHIHVDFKTSN